jgi:hypothetical protein
MNQLRSAILRIKPYIQFWLGLGLVVVAIAGGGFASAVPGRERLS